MRNYFHFDRYLNELEKDTYYQPQKGDDHLTWAKDVIDQWIPNLAVENVLDVGCGVGFCQPLFEAHEIVYAGITLDSDDLEDGKHKEGRHIWEEDFTFIDSNANAYDLIFARHALEHSPFPLITLMEWQRVAKKYLILINPVPAYWGWTGRNHYSVANSEQIRAWLKRAGWLLRREFSNDYEYWFLAEKEERQIPYYAKA